MAGRIGPYRLVRRIGSGGMGTVWEAEDERLGRRVAVKSINPGRELTPERRERLRREARAAASLVHPSVAAIHDILSDDSGDHIVMEYVEGDTLDRMLEHGRLDAAEAIGLGLRIAEGLAEAHERGVVHRDLKPENVAVDRSGEPKILDFGLAKLDEGDDATRLTQEGQVVGTLRSMSPEQASAGEVDFRSDLFSLGVLLYEMTTGRHPFEAPTAVETLRRVVDHDPPPAYELEPTVPPRLSDLIDVLMDKDPERRPSSTWEVVGALEGLLEGTRTTTAELRPISDHAPHQRRRGLAWGIGAVAAVAVAAAIWWGLAGAAADPTVVAVLPPIARSEAVPESVRTVVEVALADAMIALEDLLPVEADGKADPFAVTGADELIEAVLVDDGELVSCSILRRSPAGPIGASRTVELHAGALETAAEAVQQAVFDLYPDRRHSRSGIGDVSPEAFNELAEIVAAWHGGRDTDWERVLDRLTALRETNPGLMAAAQREVRVALYLHRLTDDPADLERAREAASAAIERAPDDPRALVAATEVSLAAGELKRAEELIARLRERHPHDPNLPELRVDIAERRGRIDEAFEILRAQVRTRRSADAHFRLANFAMHNDATEEALAHAAAAASMAPEHVAYRSKLAELELLHGSIERAEALYREQLTDRPSPVGRSNHALALLYLGRYDEAATTYRQLVDEAPDDPTFRLNLADALELAGREEEAHREYRRVVRLAAGDEPEALQLRAQALAHLGERRAAVAAIQDATRASPGDPETAFQAALVYALVGETTSARVAAERALELGISPRWFGLPWLEGVLPESTPTASRR